MKAVARVRNRPYLRENQIDMELCPIMSKWYLGKVSDMEAMRWIEITVDQKNGVKAQNTPHLPIIYFRRKKYRLVVGIELGRAFP